MINRLKKILDYYNLTASSFAEKINVPRSSISHLLSGRNKPSLDFIMKVDKTFDEIELNWLLYGKGNFPKEEQTEMTNEKKSTTPTLFSSTNENNVIPKRKETKIVHKKEPISEKQIKKIVILYTDGTFEDYNR